MPIRRHADLWVQLGLCWIFFVVLVADQAHLQNTELKAHYTFFCTCSQYRLSLLFQPIKAYCHGCPAITGLVQLSSHYRLLLAKLLFAFAIFGRPNAMQKKIPMKLPRQCLNLCILLHLSMFQCMAGQENQARDSGDSPTLEGWGILSGFFFGTLSKKKQFFICQEMEEPQSSNPEAAGSNSQASWFPKLWLELVHCSLNAVCAQEAKEELQDEALDFVVPCISAFFGVIYMPRCNSSGHRLASTTRPAFNDVLWKEWKVFSCFTGFF